MVRVGAIVVLAALLGAACAGRPRPSLRLPAPAPTPVALPALPGPPEDSVAGAIASAIRKIAVPPRLEGSRAIFEAPAPPDLAAARELVEGTLAHARAEALRLGTSIVESSGRPESFGCGIVFEPDPATGLQRRIEYELVRYCLVVVGRGPGPDGYETTRREFWLPAGTRCDPLSSIEFDRDGRPRSAGTIRIVREADGASIEVELRPPEAGPLRPGRFPGAGSDRVPGTR